MSRNFVRLVNGDAVLELKSIATESIDCIISDPPYKVIKGGVSKKDDAPRGCIKNNDGKIFRENDTEIGDWVSDCHRVLKDNSHIYIMVNFLNLQTYMEELQRVGFKLHNLLVWQKNTATPNRWYMKNCEYIIFARKGKAKSINNCGTKTVMQFDNPRNKKHPTEKPVDLLQTLVTNSTEEGDTVLDMFMGSGSTGVACVLTGRNFIGMELDNIHYNTASEYIKDNMPLGEYPLVTEK